MRLLPNSLFRPTPSPRLNSGVRRTDDRLATCPDAKTKAGRIRNLMSELMEDLPGR